MGIKQLETYQFIQRVDMTSLDSQICSLMEDADVILVNLKYEMT